MNAQMLRVVAALALLHVAVGVQDLSVCDPTMYSGKDRGIPKIPKTYRAHIETNVADKKLTVESIEVVDELSGLAKITVTANTSDSGPLVVAEVIDFNNNQAIIVTPIPGRALTKCTVHDFAKSGDRYVFGNVGPDGSTTQIFFTQGALRLAETFPTNYLGETNARGVRVDRWENCLYMKDLDATVKANWYFSVVNDWNTAVGLKQVPVRIVIEGTVTDKTAPGGKRVINHSYEFVHFRDHLFHAERLAGNEIPRHTICPGLKNTMAVPDIAASFSFTTEIVIPNAGVISTIREVYDSKMMMSRYTYVGEGGDEVSEVHDWTTGIAYVTNLVYGNCTAQPIPGGSFDAEIVSGGKVRMRTAREFFGLTNNKINYTYMGKREVRNIPSDIFNSLRDNWPPGSGENSLSIWELVFSSREIQMTGGPVNLEIQEPVQLSIVHLNNPGLSQLYNIIDFDESQPDIRNYEVGGCYKSDQKTYISFSVEGSFDYYVEDSNRELFRYFTVLSLITYTGVSPMRISGLRIGTSGRDDIWISFSLLDPPPTELSDLCDDCPRRRVNIPSEDVIALLQDAIDSKQFVIKADYDNVNDLATLRGIPGSLAINVFPVVNKDEVPVLLVLDPGAAAGIAIGLFIVGVLVTLLGLFLIVKHRGSNLPPFMMIFTPKK